MVLHIRAKRFAVWLIIAAILLVIAHIAGAISSYIYGHSNVFGLVPTFDLNVENNVPTFFSAFILVLSAVLLYVIGGQSATVDGAAYWRWLAVLFLYLAIDEDASLHELWMDPLRDNFDLTGFLHFAWIIPYGLAVLVVGLLYLRFVWSLPKRTRWLFIAAGSIYIGGAMGLEAIGGWYFSRHDEIYDLPYSLIVATEEFMEMSGVILFIYALLDFLGARLGGEPLRITVSSS